jgi:uncharacterized membrane protein YvbJ
MKFCTKCGKELLDDVVFCRGSGCTYPRRGGYGDYLMLDSKKL